MRSECFKLAIGTVRRDRISRASLLVLVNGPSVHPLRREYIVRVWYTSVGARGWGTRVGKVHECRGTKVGHEGGQSAARGNSRMIVLANLTISCAPLAVHGRRQHAR